MRLLTILLVVLAFTACRPSAHEISFTVSMEDPSMHTFRVQMGYSNPDDSVLILKMPVWTPGYYQKMPFPENVRNLVAVSSTDTLVVDQTDSNTWKIKVMGKKKITINYHVVTNTQFVASAYLDESRAYIIPGALFMYPKDEINSVITVNIQPQKKWDQIVTGLERISPDSYQYRAENYDVLYDSPLLVGDLTSLPPFEVQGVPHYFIGWQMDGFDGDSLMADLKSIISEAVNMIGDIPYRKYTFIGIGPGRGGIEHLNSTTVSFSENRLEDHESRLRMLFFLAHEYFHHYNVKRIRPIELGPFDYDHGSRTRQLWISEGLSVYYEYLLIKRAGLCTTEDLLEAFRKDIIAFENKSGKFFQSLADASYNTWSDGPKGEGLNDEFNKTISYYEKGPVVGLLLDFKIRNATNNQRSLDDLMKALYNDYYLKEDRGFTEEEFKQTVEKIAGVPVDDILEYVYTTKSLEYSKYLDYAGYQIDTTSAKVPGGWLGIKTEVRNDSVYISEIEWKSPAWDAGLRKGDVLIKAGGKNPEQERLTNVINDQAPGNSISFEADRMGQRLTVKVILGQKMEKSFEINSQSDLTDLQQFIQNEWLGVR